MVRGLCSHAAATRRDLSSFLITKVDTTVYYITLHLLGWIYFFCSHGKSMNCGSWSHVLVERRAAETVTKGGIMLSEKSQGEVLQAMVVAVGSSSKGWTDSTS